MTPTNLKKAALAIAMAGAFASGSAFALGPNISPQIELFVSGASAQDNNFGALFKDLCQAGTLDTYLDNADPAKPGAKHRAFFCTVLGTKVPGLGGNRNVLLHKRSEGGSGWGVQPIANHTKMDHMNIDVSNCTETPVGSHNWLCNLTAAGAVTKEYSDAGLSDVEPRQFKGVNVPSGFTAITAAQLARLKTQSPSALVFGVTVNTKLRNALQKALGKTVGSETAANMPSLTKAQIINLMKASGTGRITRWSQLKINGKALTAVPGVTPPADTKVRICRRVRGSGTQTQHNIKFLENPCQPGLTPAETSNNSTGPIVNLGSGSGDLEACQAAADAANLWSIGIQSTEKNADGSKPYRFVKVDNQLPTLANAVANKYFDWVEISMQWLKSGIAGAPTGSKLALLSTLAKNLGKPTIIAKENTKFKYKWGQGGYLGLKSNGYNGAFNATTYPVTPYSHKGNSCNTPVKL